ncbi:MAG: hypothetical protein IJK25_00110 [Firmicutes bacterium]|nr:hypothetical protein [Bacillota bacterium]
MKKKNLLLPVVLCTAMLMTACSGQTPAESSVEKEPIETVAATEASAAETPTEAHAAEETAITTEAEAAAPAENSENTVTEASGAITQDQAMDAVLNYFKADFPDYEIDSEHGEYWEVVTGDNGEIKVIHKSYTGAFNFYYVDPATGETYVTELVPGIIDEEQKTGETFNVNDYMN